MTNTAKLMNKIKEDPLTIDQLLYPGKHLSEFNLEDLQIDVMPSGFKGLDDKMVLKLDRGEMIVLGARPGMGKSGLGFQIAMNVAKYAKVHIFSIEMDHDSVAARQMAIIMNKPLDYIQNGGANSEEGEKAREYIKKYNCVIDDRAGLNIYQICDAARMQNKKSPTSLIVVDYLQIIQTDKIDNRAHAVAKMSWELKSLAKELRIPILVLSQLNRQSEFREGGKPALSDLKESGAIEQDADVVMLIHRPEDTPQTATIIIAKNRNGPTGDVNMQFANAQCRFLDGGGELE